MQVASQNSNICTARIEKILLSKWNTFDVDIVLVQFALMEFYVYLYLLLNSVLHVCVCVFSAILESFFALSHDLKNKVCFCWLTDKPHQIQAFLKSDDPTVSLHDHFFTVTILKLTHLSSVFIYFPKLRLFKSYKFQIHLTVLSSGLQLMRIVLKFILLNSKLLL